MTKQKFGYSFDLIGYSVSAKRDCELRTVDCGLRTAHCGLRTADCEPALKLKSNSQFLKKQTESRM